jgi:hypothetical protein
VDYRDLAFSGEPDQFFVEFRKVLDIADDDVSKSPSTHTECGLRRLLGIQPGLIIDIGGDIIMTGGDALNTGLHKAFEDELMADIYVANYPQFNGSLGAALLAKERAEKA